MIKLSRKKLIVITFGLLLIFSLYFSLGCMTTSSSTDTSTTTTSSSTTTEATETTSTTSPSGTTSSTSSSATTTTGSPTTTTTTSSTTTSTGTGQTVARTVLAEVFTGTWCGWCPYADVAIEQLATEEGSDTLVVLEYHVSDTFEANGATDRKNQYGVTGYPTVVFDGTTVKRGANPDNGDGTDYEQLCYEAYSSTLTTRQASSSVISISGSVNIANNTATVSATVTNEGGSGLSNVVIGAVIYEDLNESEFRFVVRSILSTETISSFAAGSSQSYTKSGTLPAGVEASNCAAIIYTQRSSNNEILNAKEVSP